MRIRRIDMRGGRFSSGLRQLNRELDRVAEKHGIEEPLPFMPTPDFPFGPTEDDDDDC